MLNIDRQTASERGSAMVATVILSALVILFGILVATNAITSNNSTKLDAHREGGFQAANAGYDAALSCLTKLNPQTQIPDNCDVAASTTMTDAGASVGSYTVDVTDITPIGSSTKRVLIRATGNGPTSQAGRATRRVEAQVELVPVGGFFYTVFAGAPSGGMTFKNNATVSGITYSHGFDSQKNNAVFGDVQVVNSFTSKNNDLYKSVWAGGDVTANNNTVIQTFAKACGSTGAGNASFGSGASVTGLLQYKGSLTPGSSCCGSVVKAACSGPPALSLPVFSFSASNYPGWTVVNFSGPTAVAQANLCLSTRLAFNCGGYTIGDTPSSYGKSAGGVVINVTQTSCGLSNLSFGSGTVTISGNFTLITNCKMTASGTFTPAAGLPSGKQVVLVSTSATGTDDLAVDVQSSSANLSILAYSGGEVSTKNGLSIAAGALYGGTVTGKNNVTIAPSSDLSSYPPAGFTFDQALSVRYTPLLVAWREIAPS